MNRENIIAFFMNTHTKKGIYVYTHIFATALGNFRKDMHQTVHSAYLPGERESGIGMDFYLLFYTLFSIE